MISIHKIQILFALTLVSVNIVRYLYYLEGRHFCHLPNYLDRRLDTGHIAQSASKKES